MAVTRQTSRRTIVLQPTNAEVSTTQSYTPRYEFLVDGELSLPVPRVINSLKHQDAAANIYRCDVSVNKGGTSQYRVVITSYNQVGGDPIVHVDQFVTIMNDRVRTVLPVLNAAVAENRSLECTVTESNAVAPATDMTVTLTMENFSDIDLTREGHEIMDEAGVVQAQKPTLQFKQATVIEDTLNQRTVVETFGHVIQNGVGSNMPQRDALRIVGATVTDTPTATRVDVGFIGQMLESMLTESQMQSLYGTGWILADGRNVVGSTYWSITGATTVPDARGVFRRAKNNGRGDGNQDPSGERGLGGLQSDAFQGHHHQFFAGPNTGDGGSGSGANDVDSTATQYLNGNVRNPISDGVNGTPRTASETRPRNIAVNVFMKIN